MIKRTRGCFSKVSEHLSRRHDISHFRTCLSKMVPPSRLIVFMLLVLCTKSKCKAFQKNVKDPSLQRKEFRYKSKILVKTAVQFSRAVQYGTSSRINRFFLVWCTKSKCKSFLVNHTCDYRRMWRIQVFKGKSFVLINFLNISIAIQECFEYIKMDYKSKVMAKPDDRFSRTL